jgi:type III pantothenate kinase
MREEMKGIISLYDNRYKGLNVILTGGDAFRFAGDLNLSIFAAADLVNIGLNEIIRYNRQKRK